MMTDYETKTDPIMSMSLTMRKQSADLKAVPWKDEVERRARSVILVVAVGVVSLLLAVGSNL